MITLSTVTPVYSGQDYLEKLVSGLDGLRTKLRDHSENLRLTESIFILDGAIDSSAKVLQKLAKSHDWLRIVELSRNFGQHNATVAGILHSSGDWLVTLDEGLQHPPEKILKMLATAFHFISSAGGLFEGQALVGEASSVSPRRPFGEMKQRQEILLREHAHIPQAVIRIYRPSTVYRTHRFNVRSGLVSHLVWNALRNCPTTLETNLHALRDYVFDDDVERFIEQQIQAGGGEQRDLSFLESGKPSSIFEVVPKVERMIGRSILYQFSSRQRNDANITFRNSLLPIDWNPTALDVGLQEVLRKTKESYLLDTTV